MAAARCRGECVFVQDDDDFFGPSRFRAQAAALARGAGACLLGQETESLFYYDAGERAFASAVGSSFAQPCSMAFRRSVHRGHGGGAVYPEDLDAGEDLEFFGAILGSGAAVATADGVPWVRCRHAANVVQDAAGDGEEAAAEEAYVAERRGLPASTLAALRRLPGARASP